MTAAIGLSDLLAWPTNHLTQAADHWEALGERSFGVAHGVWSDALAVDWRGEAADALRTDTHSDLQTTSGVADQLQAAAGIARGGASDLDAARSQIRYAVEDARSAGFVVDEDLSIVDRFTGGSRSEQAARQAAAEAFADEIGGRATQLVDLDEQVAGKITAAMAGVGNTFPAVKRRQSHEAPERHGVVRAVDWSTDKPPAPPKPPDPPKGPSAADMRKVLDQLPKNKGARDGNRNVKSPEDLERLRLWMTEHGADMPSRYEEPGDGRWKRLPDGSEVGERYEANSTKEKALDIDLRGSDGKKEHWKIHINPQKGGIPELPATPEPAKPEPAESAPKQGTPAKAAPSETEPSQEAPAKPAQAEPEPAPSRAAPAERGLPPEGIATSPGEEALPHFVPEPGSKHHLGFIPGLDQPGEEEEPRDFSH